MIEVRAKYFNARSHKEDYFIYTDVEVKGHSETCDNKNNIRLCAGISACCFGIKNIIDGSQYKYKIDRGYFRCVRDTKALTRDKQTIYALNTLVCQLYELYKNYPNAFVCFDLVDIKEKN